MLNKYNIYVLLDNMNNFDINGEFHHRCSESTYSYLNCDMSSLFLLIQLNFDDDASYFFSIVNGRFKCHLEVELLKDETFLLIFSLSFLSMPCVHMFDFFFFVLLRFFFFKSN